MRDLGRDFGRRQHAAMARLGTLTQLDLNHLNLRISRLLFKCSRIKGSIFAAAAEVSGCDLINDVTAAFAVMNANSTFSGVMREPASLCATVQCADSVA